ncbi:MAG TPA: hypothetical protein VL326_37635 [Kofleriaceae bacterium]|nr:hypothetical protein [Kofleriaceae bacterium]
MKRAWICIGVVAACHGGSRKEPATTGSAGSGNVAAAVAEAKAQPPPSPLADSFATLPLSIVSAEPAAVAGLEAQVMGDEHFFEAACWKAISSKIDGYYEVDLAKKPDQAVFHSSIVHGGATLDGLRRCRKADKDRKESKNPKIVVVRDVGFFPIVVVDIGNGWMLVLDGDLEPLLAAAESVAKELPTTTRNGLANAVGMKPEPGWHAIGLDVTSELFGVPSIGARADFTPTPVGEPLKGPVTLTAYFASADDAKKALAAVGQRRDDAFDDLPMRTLETARKVGEVGVEGATVVYRGPLPKELADQEGLFAGFGRPIQQR